MGDVFRAHDGEKGYDGQHADTKQDYGLDVVPVYDSDGEAVEFDEKKELRRGLQQRHIQMIALAGTIGTGLFLSSGRAIVNGGPLGALLGYAFVGVLVVAPVWSIAELSSLVPLSGGVVRHAEYFVDPALSFATGWNTIYSYMMSLPAEIVAAAVIVDFWNDSISNAIWITIFGLLLVASNVFLVRIYGELEFGFSMLKIMLVVGTNLMALVVVCGGGPNHEAYGFRYWHNPGPLVQYLGIKGSLGRFLGFWTTFDNAVFAYSGVENISMAAAETKSPRRNIPIAAKRIFVRVALFYVVSIFFVGLLVPSNSPDLLSGTGSGTAAASPFVIAARSAGIKVVPSIINAVVLTSAWSAGNSGLLNGSRTLFGLAKEGRAPAFFGRVSRFGIPYVAVIFLALFVCLGYMSLSSGAATVFGWLQDLVSVSALINWSIICLTYLRFYYAMKKQGISRDRLPWKAPFQPYVAWVGLVFFILLLLTGGFKVFIHNHWDSETFVSSYVNIPIIFALYFGWKLVKKSKIVPLDQAPVLKYIEIHERNPEPIPTPVTGWRRLNILWS
ncbi:amino acid transporter-like protein [Teratosphaeria nubilosa]|uniref:Amino acid transporter-like protein n=1 Tax=Teratosphaeria nubilosa TaxID=161662 RepID=A0A6G1LAG7_9PEZI|nr:amino acid transporter-like protein [Teratosphaeria nubilosa]